MQKLQFCTRGLYPISLDWNKDFFHLLQGERPYPRVVDRSAFRAVSCYRRILPLSHRVCDLISALSANQEGVFAIG